MVQYSGRLLAGNISNISFFILKGRFTSKWKHFFKSPNQNSSCWFHVQTFLILFLWSWTIALYFNLIKKGSHPLGKLCQTKSTDLVWHNLLLKKNILLPSEVKLQPFLWKFCVYIDCQGSRDSLQMHKKKTPKNTLQSRSAVYGEDKVVASSVVCVQ